MPVPGHAGNADDLASTDDKLQLIQRLAAVIGIYVEPVDGEQRLAGRTAGERLRRRKLLADHQPGELAFIRIGFVDRMGQFSFTHNGNPIG
ncbi:hypothetical protein D3C84_1126750 [compost metagenome]